MTFDEAIAEVKRVTPPSSPWEAGDIGVGAPPIDYHICTILNAVVSGELVKSGWQPIANAPRDGATIVALRAGLGHSGYSLIFWDDTDDEWAGYTAEDEKRLVKFQPTHWMPLPQPPALADHGPTEPGQIDG